MHTHPHTPQHTSIPVQRKGPCVGIFLSGKIRFYRAVQNFLKKNFLCEFAYKHSLLCMH